VRRGDGVEGLSPKKPEARSRKPEAGSRKPGDGRGLGEEEFEVFGLELGDEAFVFADDGGGEVAFGLLEEENFFLDGVAGDEAVGEDGFGLTDAVGTVDGLGFDGGVPPWVEEEDVVGGGEVEADAAGFEGDEEEGAGGIGLKTVDALAAVAGLTVEVLVGEAGEVEVVLEDGEEGGELGEDEGFVTLVDDFGELWKQRFQLGGGLLGAMLVDEPGVAGSLAEAEEGFEDKEAGLGHAVGGDAVEEGVAVMVAEFVVELALFGVKLAVESLLGFVGELADDLLFGAAEDIRA
jgi:hypothetical protein